MNLKKCTLNQLKKMCHKKQWIVYGYNEWSEEVLMKTGIINEVAFIIDNNSYIWGTSQEIGDIQIQIYSPDSLATFNTEPYNILIAAMYYEQLYGNIQSFLGKFNNINIYYCLSEDDNNLSRFRSVFMKLKLKDRIIFRSGPEKAGDLWDFADNARALFEYMLENQYNQKYELIWAVGDINKYLYLEDYENVKVISYRDEKARGLLKSFVYQYYLYTAKFFFFTDTCTWLRFRRSGQVLVNLWHGCGFKNRKNKTEPTGPHYDYMTVTSQKYADIHADIFGCKKEQMLITGLAKQDWLFHPANGELSDLLNIKPCKKNIFWLPTFRRTISGLERLNESYVTSITELPVLTTLEDLYEIDKWLGSNDVFLFVKLHPNQPYIKQEYVRYNNMKIMTHDEFMILNIPINRLLAKSDALISDYSSVAVDYMLLDKPIAFTLDDIEEYETSRGFVFSDVKNYLPGKMITTKDNFLDFMKEIIEEKDVEQNKRKQLLEVMHKYQDDKNCLRILETIGVSK